MRVRAVFGREADDENDIVVLGRVVRWGCAGVELEAGEKHGSLIQKDLGTIPESNSLVSPAAPAEADDDGSGERLGREEASKYRPEAARANNLGVDRPDLHFAIKEACRGWRRKARRTCSGSRALPATSRRSGRS